MESIEEKYRLAVQCLQAISQRSGYSKEGFINEWTEARAFRDCSEAAYNTLIRIGEETSLPNRKGKRK